MSEAFQQEVFRRFDRLDGKIDAVTDAHAELDKKVALADQRHGIVGSISGGIGGVLTAAIAYFLAPRH